MNTLTIPINGRVDTTNAPKVEEMIFGEMSQNPSDQVILDLENLEYISSAGLRVFLKVAKEAKKLQAINASPEVYEIFDVTGFTDILDVKKALKNISIEGCELIGYGGEGSVYKLNDETIVKVFNKDASLERIDAEREKTKRAFLMGIPTMIPFNVVKVGDRYGTIYELLNAQSLLSVVEENPDLAEEYGRELGRILKKLHSNKSDVLEAAGIESPKQTYSEFFKSKLQDPRAKDFYTKEQIERLQRLADAIPYDDTVIHGDYHTENVLVDNGQLLIIDLGTLKAGHPVMDLAGPRSHMALFEASSPEKAKLIEKIWDYMIREYFGTEDEAEVNHYKKIAESYAFLRFSLAPFSSVALSDEVKGTIEKMVERCCAIIEEDISEVPETLDF